MEYSADERCPLWVGMSVPAHPQAVERLVGQGNRGGLKPPSPEEGSLDVENGRGSKCPPFDGIDRRRSRAGVFPLQWIGEEDLTQSRQAAKGRDIYEFLSFKGAERTKGGVWCY